MMPNTLRHLLPLAALAAAACPPPAATTPRTATAPASAPASAPAPLRLDLPRDLEPRRQAYKREVTAALDHVLGWFARHGFARSRTGIVDQIVVFRDRRQMKQRLARRFKLTPDKIPDTFGGTVDKKTLLVVREEMFKDAYTKLYPKMKWDSGTYRRLMIHELAHRVHAMIATELFGTEDGMGPRWFFEGLAILVAEQFPGHEPPHLTWAQLTERVAWDKKGIQTYPIYKHMLRSLTASFTPEHLIRRAGKPGFFEALKQEYKPARKTAHRRTAGDLPKPF